MRFDQFFERVLGVAGVVEVGEIGQRFHHGQCVLARLGQHGLGLSKFMAVDGAYALRTGTDQRPATL